MTFFGPFLASLVILVFAGVFLTLMWQMFNAFDKDKKQYNVKHGYLWALALAIWFSIGTGVVNMVTQ